MGMIGYWFRADAALVRQVETEGCSAVFFAEANADRLMDADKAWHIIHYTLSGTVWDVPPEHLLSQLVLGGEIFVEEDLGYGPARILPPETVRRLAQALGPWEEPVFRAHFHMKEMLEKQIYPLIEGEDEETCFAYAWEHFERLRAFFRDAAQRQESVFAFVS